MNTKKTPVLSETTRYTFSVEKKFHEKITLYSAKKRIPLAVLVREWIKEGYKREKEKDKMSI